MSSHQVGSVGGALAALVAIALIWAGPAVAEPVLCKANTGASPCPVLQSNPPGWTASSSQASIDFGELGEVTCTESTLVASDNEKVDTWSFSGCTESCVVKAGNLPYGAALTPEGEGDGTLSVGSGGSGEPRLTVTCGAAECVYGSTSLSLAVLGGEPASIGASLALGKKSGNSFFCPATLGFDASYTISKPSPAFVEHQREDETVLCDVNEEKCPEEHIFKEPTVSAKLLEKTSSLFLNGFISCSKSSLELSMGEPSGGYALDVSLDNLQFGSCGGAGGEVICTVKALGLPYVGEFEAGEGGNGIVHLTIDSESLLEFDCLKAGKCTAPLPDPLDLVFEGGNPAELHINTTLPGCGPLTWKAGYEAITPEGPAFASVVFP